MSKTAHIIAAAGVLVSALAALPGFIGLARGEGVTQPYRDILSHGKTEPSEETTPEPVTPTAPPAAPGAAPPVATAAGPIGAEGLAMQRMSQDPRLSMRVVAVTPHPTSDQLVNVRFELASTGAESSVFVDADSRSRSWGLDGDHAGGCWQQRQSGLAEFQTDDLATEEPTWLAPGTSVTINSTFQCDNVVVPGDVFTAKAQTMLATGEGLARTAREIEFRSPPFVLQ